MGGASDGYQAVPAEDSDKVNSEYLAPYYFVMGTPI